MELLEEIGFTHSEAAVYKALLELGTATTGPLLERSGIASSKIYEVLERLIAKGFASYIYRGKIKEFRAANPQRLIEFLHEEQSKLQRQTERAQQLVSELELKKHLAKKEQNATIYRGYKGVETAFNEALSVMKKGDVILVTNSPQITDQEDRFFKHWNQRRAKKGVHLHMILDGAAKGQYQARPESQPLSALRFLPASQRVAAAVNIYADRVILFLPKDAAGDRLLVVILGKAIVDSFRLQFEAQWSLATVAIHD